MNALMLVTEFPFTLPVGHIDSDGNLHREGIMRRATARDEIEPMRDPRVKQNPAYLPVIVLARTVIKLGAVAAITPKLIEDMAVADFDYLQRLYNQVNQYQNEEVKCPTCGALFHPESDSTGES